MYAEGDDYGLKHECALHLKEALREIVAMLKVPGYDGVLDLGVVLTLYKAEI